MAPVVKEQGKGRKILGVLATLFILLGLYWGLVKAPPDAFQGDVQRIMYLHIPSILTAYLSFFIVFVGSCLFL
ncbi:MAG: cytochrome C assembly protein, partial [Candidatus Binatia bacterium]